MGKFWNDPKKFEIFSGPKILCAAPFTRIVTYVHTDSANDQLLKINLRFHNKTNHELKKKLASYVKTISIAIEKFATYTAKETWRGSTSFNQSFSKAATADGRLEGSRVNSLSSKSLALYGMLRENKRSEYFQCEQNEVRGSPTMLCLVARAEE